MTMMSTDACQICIQNFCILPPFLCISIMCGCIHPSIMSFIHCARIVSSGVSKEGGVVSRVVGAIPS
ncbi:hypothetical protein BCR43DRAFT_497031 [Syncephalastrum racemosum]|uniref:Uncharacterized protein n=1 Tax=Syncephalastrum racemosum TaxID=13706 RepID=A0A1X2H512_SYNRA|nr:hypothetical protein BCR43DRAFT_497031 [Syncephalastrum racemosum]